MEVEKLGKIINNVVLCWNLFYTELGSGGPRGILARI